jgi:5'-nucleotidase
MWLRRGLIALVLGLAALAALPIGFGGAQAPWTLTIVHSNDMHSRLQAVNRFDSTCSDRERDQKQCFGGFARVATKAKEIAAEVRAANGNVLVLDAGDPFQGSMFYSHYKGKAELDAMNLVGYDAMAVGNHEFDDGAKPLASFIDGARFPVISANVVDAADPDLRGKIKPSIVLERGGRKIGIIGLTTEDTPQTSKPPATIRFVAAAEALKPQIDAFKRDGVEIVIVLSHLGLARDRELAAAIDGIDVIVGGHSHTLLSNTIQGAAGTYPVLGKSPSGRDVPIVQAGANTRYLGRIDLRFDNAGNVVGWSGDAIPLVHDIPEDPEVARLVATLAVPLDELRKKVIGASAQEIVQANCRKEECLMGNFVADVILQATKHLGVTAVIQNGGGLRAAIGQGDVTMGAVLTVLPFQNTIATVGVKGSDLVAALENGVSQVEQNGGRFPQVAGMRYVWDPKAAPGSRIVEVEMRGADGGYKPIDPAATYKIATNDFVRQGGDGYAMLRDRGIDPYDFGPGLEDTVAAFVSANSPIRVSLEGRIKTKQ